MNFGEALEALKNGKCVARSGWNGRNMFVHLNPGSTPNSTPTSASGLISGVSVSLFEEGSDGTITRMPNLNLKAADGTIITGWLASQTDLLAEDWRIVDP